MLRSGFPALAQRLRGLWGRATRPIYVDSELISASYLDYDHAR